MPAAKHMERVESVFTKLIAHPKENHQDLLDSLCADNIKLRAEVESLLQAADQAKGFLSEGALATSWPLDSSLNAEEMLGQQLDSWQIVRELDSGGMGIVFLAERIDGHYQQQVAIKLAKLGLVSGETISRFHTERQILANLRHPNIAQLLDGGTGPDGQPYLVMEYVQGVPINIWCESQQLNVEQILHLFGTVCDAVQYAHKNLVVHCDLKPSNILVSEGEPILLDFGIATLLGGALPESVKSVQQRSAGGAIPMTPTFAAPEQIAGKSVTTATDVYALGVVLYLLLTGKHPYAISSNKRLDVAEALEDIEIKTPSSVARESHRKKLEGDLDKIVLKALSKDPQQRYASAQDFSNELSMFQKGFPVSVGRQSWVYRTGKFIKRHRLPVALTILSLLIVWAGSLFGLWQWRVAQERQDLAEQRLTEVRNMISTLVVDLPETFASQPASTPLRVQLLDQGIAKLDELVKSQPDNPELVRELATAYAQLGRLQGYPASVNLGEPEKAAATYEKSLLLQEDLLPHFQQDVDFAVELATNYSALTLIYFTSLREIKPAFEYAKNCQNLLKPWVQTAHQKVLWWIMNCYTLEAKWHSDERNYPKAQESVSNAHTLFQAEAANDEFTKSFLGYRTLVRIHEEWAEIEANVGSLEKALEHEYERLKIVLAHLQDDQGSVQLYGPARITADAYHAYGARLAGVGRFDDAVEAYIQSIQLWTEVSETFPSDYSAVRSLVYVHADFAELQQQRSLSLTDHRKASQLREQACVAYEFALENVRKMPGDPEKIAKRYSWSLRPSQFRPRYNALCKDSKQAVG